MGERARPDLDAGPRTPPGRRGPATRRTGCWSGPVDDATLEQAVAAGALTEVDVAWIREFRALLAAEAKRRRSRQVVVRPDGTKVVQAKAPRADLLWYPHERVVTVLVRRTHDLELARQLANERWSATPPQQRGTSRLLSRHRTGWWTTTDGLKAVPPRAAVDEQHRVIRWCSDPGTARAAGPGIEFRP
ncbi:hypothetical protein K1T35_48130 (plasmid) [Pseudonocardia sp. DSM 110487]|uniref:hypothetical protein n=1 Tax=Pseudonocardia sp. DSM 110487 TaxID=2865833 RepID=UPI001C694551|nr:hypothetical protein [Pseudonocardia sp. DSM 110487]QYN41118.1 hypothetical protein K1T35_48130 [Pseudonocardia sp. DSM 110487]